MAAFTLNIETDTVSQSKISNLDFMVGRWQGSGWMFNQDRLLHEFDQTEDIQYT
jgi:hypothetical protein